jgi:hypothetical protein
LRWHRGVGSIEGEEDEGHRKAGRLGLRPIGKRPDPIAVIDELGTRCRKLSALKWT